MTRKMTIVETCDGAGCPAWHSASSHKALTEVLKKMGWLQGVSGPRGKTFAYCPTCRPTEELKP